MNTLHCKYIYYNKYCCIVPASWRNLYDAMLNGLFPITSEAHTHAGKVYCTIIIIIRLQDSSRLRTRFVDGCIMYVLGKIHIVIHLFREMPKSHTKSDKHIGLINIYLSLHLKKKKPLPSSKTVGILNSYWYLPIIT